MFNKANHVRQIMHDIERSQVSEKNSTAAKAPRVIAVTGGKGGVGKTLTTANLGLCLSRLGMRTLLVDGDFGLANLDVIMGVRVVNTLDDVLLGEKHVRDIIVDGPEGLKLVPAASGLMRAGELGQVQKLVMIDQIESLSEDYDVILIDTPAGISNKVQYWTASASEVIVVVTPEPSSMADAYAMMKVLSHMGLEEQFRLLVNMARTEEEGLMVFERLSSLAEEHLKIKLSYLGCTVFDEAVRSSVRERNLFVQKYPFSAAAKGMRNIAAQLVSEKQRRLPKGTVQFFWKSLVTNSNEANW